VNAILHTSQKGWASFQRSWLITRREVRDTLRDWRLVIPILLLTLVFPALMQFTADSVQRWAVRWGGISGVVVGERIMPFLMMIVGFFPISFSLVIALETFVGEKERHSLEPLLATPLTNAELYWGKTLAAMIPPLAAAYVGLGVYLAGLYFTIGWTPPLQLFSLVILLTTAEALVMVSAAVVISSQTTSVRAANILASFIIIPMALLIQGESVILFWAQYEVLWWIVGALVAANLLLVRMGVRLFDREELLGRDIDQLEIKRAWRTWLGFILNPPEPGGASRDESRPALSAANGPFSIARLYLHDIPRILRTSWMPIAVVTLALVAAFAVGWAYSIRYPLPRGIINLDISEADIIRPAAFEDIPDLGALPSLNVGAILLHNLRVLVAEALLGLFSFGTLAMVLLMIPIALVGFFSGQMPMMGASPLLFLATFILPHGVIELPAAILATGMALRLGAAVISPPSGLSLRQGLLLALADFAKVFVFLVIPLLGLAAMLEVWLTPWIVVRVW
jgi:ABC-type transport system involved in multi-copper enzyme maturation permease subunit